MDALRLTSLTSTSSNQFGDGKLKSSKIVSGSRTYLSLKVWIEPNTKHVYVCDSHGKASLFRKYISINPVYNTHTHIYNYSVLNFRNLIQFLSYFKGYLILFISCEPFYVEWSRHNEHRMGSVIFREQRFAGTRLEPGAL